MQGKIQLYIYYISQSANNDYETYDSAVVIADNPVHASLIYPGCDGELVLITDRDCYWEWVDNPELVTVTRIGVADEGEIMRVVCASFNAG